MGGGSERAPQLQQGLSRNRCRASSSLSCPVCLSQVQSAEKVLKAKSFLLGSLQRWELLLSRPPIAPGAAEPPRLRQARAGCVGKGP